MYKTIHISRITGCKNIKYTYKRDVENPILVKTEYAETSETFSDKLDNFVEASRKDITLMGVKTFQIYENPQPVKFPE